MQSRYLEILEFTQFFDHFVFTPNEENVLEKFEKEIIETMMPAIISELVLEKKVTENSSDEEVRQTIISYLRSGQLDLMNVAITMGSFKKGI